jgi:hypothetical protein
MAVETWATSMLGITIGDSIPVKEQASETNRIDMEKMMIRFMLQSPFNKMEFCFQKHTIINRASPVHLFKR